MWPFRKSEPDNRPAMNCAHAIADSLRAEPQRWRIGEQLNWLVHDSGIMLDTDDYTIRQPWIPNEPDANETVISSAVDEWIGKTLRLPAPPKPSPVPSPQAEGQP